MADVLRHPVSNSFLGMVQNSVRHLLLVAVCMSSVIQSCLFTQGCVQQLPRQRSMC